MQCIEHSAAAARVPMVEDWYKIEDPNRAHYQQVFWLTLGELLSASEFIQPDQMIT